jgi:hypothetical protein
MFLERRTYRQTRLQDAAKLLPVLGLILIFGPIFIRDDTALAVDARLEPETAPAMAGELVYYFAVWLGLIVLTAVVSRAMGPIPGPDAIERQSVEAGAPVGNDMVEPPSGPALVKTQTGREGDR